MGIRKKSQNVFKFSRSFSDTQALSGNSCKKWKLEGVTRNVKPDLACQFEKFLILMTRYNLKINLFSKNTSAEKHLADSYLGLKIILKLLSSREIQPVYDFGSGNGFPGLVAAVMKPERKFVLVEKNQRKARFLKWIAGELGLKNIEVFNGQAHCLDKACVQFGISRAMAPIPRFLIEIKNVTSVNSRIFLFKGKNWERESKACSSEILKFWQIEEVGSYLLEDRRFFIIACLKI